MDYYSPGGVNNIKTKKEKGMNHISITLNRPISLTVLQKSALVIVKPNATASLKDCYIEHGAHGFNQRFSFVDISTSGC